MPLFLENDLALECLRWAKHVRGNTLPSLARQKKAIEFWMERLRGVNLRRVTLRDHILPALENGPDRRHRLVVVKTFYSYLRKERHLLTSAEDATLDLKVPQTSPEQSRRSKVVPREHIDLVIEYVRAKEQESRAKREARESARQRPSQEGNVLQLVPRSETAKEPREGPWSDALTIQAGTGGT